MKIICHKKIAAMYSKRFLKLIKDSSMASLRDSPDRSNDARILFGEDISQRQLEQMSPTDLFARQLLHVSRSTPAEYRFSETEVIGKKVVSPDEVYITVRHTGVAAAPHLHEEEIMHFIKEDGKWRIDF